MTLVRRPSPFGEILSLSQAMDRLLEDSFVRGRTWGPETSAMLPLDITSSADALEVEAALPGIKPNDVEITVEDGTSLARSGSLPTATSHRRMASVNAPASRTPPLDRKRARDVMITP